MKKQNEKFVRANCIRPHFEGITQKDNGITLIALIITIIVMLILVGVTVNVALNGGLFDIAKQAASGMNKAQIEERAYMIKMTLMADMEAKDDIIVATQEFKNRLVSELGGEIKGNKVIVSDGKYDIIVKNSNLDIEVKEHNDYVNINSIITPKISYTTTTEGDTVIGANFNLDLTLNVPSSAEYVALRKQEAMDKAAAATYEEKTTVVLEYLSTQTKTEITSIDDYFLLAVNSMLTENGLDTHDTLEECLVDENIRAKAGVAEGEEFTKGQIYNYFMNGDISQELTEQQVVETCYNSISQSTIDTNEYTKEYQYATQNLTIGLKKGNKIQIKDVSNLVDGNEYSFEITENGTYEILIGNRTTGEDILVQEEKIIVNNMREAENGVSREEATGIWTTDGKGTITKYSGTETNITVPKYIGAEKITTIGGSMFNGNKNIESVVIPDSVTAIGNRAFYKCTSLTSVVIPDSVITIETEVFYGCISLISVTIPNSVTTIKSDAFSGCTSLTEIAIPNSVTSLSGFGGCTGLTEIEIPNSVTAIGERAFAGCTGLTEIEIPNSVTTIGGSAFAGCTGLTEIEIPNSVTAIGERAFAGCTGLTQIEISNLVTTIETNLFLGCTNLESIKIPNSVTTFRLYIFEDCEKLTSITIPNSVTNIDPAALNGGAITNIYFIKGTNEKPSGEPWGAVGATVTEIDPPTTE